MSIMSLTLRASVLALLATFAIAAAEPVSAAAAKPEIAKSSSNDVSMAGRHHRVQRHAPRDAYGAYVGGAGAAPAQTWNNYGNGVGDNSRNQTW